MAGHLICKFCCSRIHALDIGHPMLHTQARHMTHGHILTLGISKFDNQGNLRCAQLSLTIVSLQRCFCLSPFPELYKPTTCKFERWSEYKYILLWSLLVADVWLGMLSCVNSSHRWECWLVFCIRWKALSWWWAAKHTRCYKALSCRECTLSHELCFFSHCDSWSLVQNNKCTPCQLKGLCAWDYVRFPAEACGQSFGHRAARHIIFERVLILV